MANPTRLKSLTVYSHFKSNIDQGTVLFRAVGLNQCKTDSRQITSQLVIFSAQVIYYWFSGKFNNMK